MKKILGASVPLWFVSVGVAAITAQAPPARNVWDGVYTAEQAARGAKVFETRCASCHGGDMTGGPGIPGLAGIEFTAGWNNTTAWGLFDVMKGSMPADNPGGLSDAQYAELLAAIFEANKFPVGTAELSADRAALEVIRITRNQP
jgi:S-disulfanyl-L-cysteine oxidoreductase SoxD